MEYKVAHDYVTHLYLVYPNRFWENITQFWNKLCSIYSKTIKVEGCFEEVVSSMEYDLALSLGFEGSHYMQWLNKAWRGYIRLY